MNEIDWIQIAIHISLYIVGYYITRTTILFVKQCFAQNPKNLRQDFIFMLYWWFIGFLIYQVLNL